MSLQTVRHLTFGEGVILSLEGKYITVNFGGDIGEKTFVYPDAFEKYLEYNEPETQNSIMEIIQKKKDRLKIEEELKAEALKKAAERAEEERKKISGTSRATTRKTTKRKKTVEEVIDEVING